MESNKQQYQNWTVDSGQHSLDISIVEPGKQYWVTMAAVNGAGVGKLSDPHGFIISETNSYLPYYLIALSYRGVKLASLISICQPRTVCFYSDLDVGGATDSDNPKQDVFTLLTLLQDPVLIGSIGALLWCLLMIAAVLLFRRQSSAGQLLPHHGKTKGV